MRLLTYFSLFALMATTLASPGTVAAQTVADDLSITEIKIEKLDAQGNPDPLYRTYTIGFNRIPSYVEFSIKEYGGSANVIVEESISNPNDTHVTITPENWSSSLSPNTGYDLGITARDESGNSTGSFHLFYTNNEENLTTDSLILNNIEFDKTDVFGAPSEAYRTVHLDYNLPPDEISITVAEIEFGGITLLNKTIDDPIASSITISPNDWEAPFQPNSVYTITIEADSDHTGNISFYKEIIHTSDFEPLEVDPLELLSFEVNDYDNPTATGIYKTVDLIFNKTASYAELTITNTETGEIIVDDRWDNFFNPSNDMHLLPDPDGGFAPETTYLFEIKGYHEPTDTYASDSMIYTTGVFDPLSSLDLLEFKIVDSVASIGEGIYKDIHLKFNLIPDYLSLTITDQENGDVILEHESESASKETVIYPDNWSKSLTEGHTYTAFLLAGESESDTVVIDQKEFIAQNTSADPGIFDENITIEEMEKIAEMLIDSSFDQITDNLRISPSSENEDMVMEKYLKPLFEVTSSPDEIGSNILQKFIAYGTDYNTNILGAGERAAVVHSYYAAYGKYPNAVWEYADLIRIANGRFPAEESLKARQKAYATFEQIYKREPISDNENDKAALAVMSYGLRQQATNRNLASEAAAIRTFDAIFGHAPQTTEEWNALQAIAYSGATREVSGDADKDGLLDSQETNIGTDMYAQDTDQDGLSDGKEVNLYETNPLNPDTDGDGFNDGQEVSNNYNPLGAGRLF